MQEFMDRSIPLTTGFALHAKRPLDPRLIVNTVNELLAMPNIEKYTGMRVVVLKDKVQYQLMEDGTWEPCHSLFIFGEGAPAPDTGNPGDMYIDTANNDLYYKMITDKATIATEWKYLINLKGDKGDQGIQGVKGNRGSLWYVGEACYEVDDQPHIYPNTEIEDARLGDLYLNLTGEIYECTTAGDANAAEWTRRESIIGPKGDQGLSAYEVALNNGFEGDEQAWLESLKGLGVPEDVPGRVEQLEQKVSKLEVPDPVISSFSMTPTICNKGDRVDQVTFQWTLEGDPASLTLTKTDSQGPIDIELSVEDNAEGYDYLESITETTTFSLCFTDSVGDISNTVSGTIEFCDPIYYTYSSYIDITSPDTNFGDITTALASAPIQYTSSENHVNIDIEDAGSNYIYVAVPQTLTRVQLLVNGINGGFNTTSEGISFNGVQYDLYQSVNHSFQNFLLVVSFEREETEVVLE